LSTMLHEYIHYYTLVQCYIKRLLQPNTIQLHDAVLAAHGKLFQLQICSNVLFVQSFTTYIAPNIQQHSF